MAILLDRGIERLVFDQPEPSCVLYLPGLPGGSNKVYDRSPYANIGTITGAIWVRLPSGLWCLSYDGQDDQTNCGNHTSLQLSVLTILVWLKTSYTADVYKGILAKQFAYAFGIKSSKLASYDWGGAGWRLNGVANIADGYWHLVGMTIDGTTAQFYVDTVVDGNSFAYSVSNQTKAVFIGSGIETGEFIDADIALPRIYNRALSTFKIQNHFNREKHLFGVW